MLHVIRAEHVFEHRLHLWFSDQSHGEANFAEILDGPIFAPLVDVDYFRQFRLEGHTLSWPNGADFAPEYLHDLVLSKSTAK